MSISTATIAENVSGDPEIGREVVLVKPQKPDIFGVKQKLKVIRRRRALIGWNHQDNSSEGLRDGKVWCWVSAGNRPKLQIFDETFNRSSRPGQVVFCGVANFTMVRMFHPYWCTHGKIPRDMVPKDKEACRFKYKALMHRHGYSDESESENEPENAPEPVGGQSRRSTVRGRGRGRGHSDTGRRARGHREMVTGQDFIVSASGGIDAVDACDSNNNQYDDYFDLDFDETEEESDDDEQRPHDEEASVQSSLNLQDTEHDVDEGLRSYDTLPKVEEDDHIKAENEREAIFIDLVSDSESGNNDDVDEDGSELFFRSGDGEIDTASQGGTLNDELDATLDAVIKEEMQTGLAAFLSRLQRPREVITIDDD